MGLMGRAVAGWWAELTDGYLRSLTRRNRRPNTIVAYRSELDDFGHWLLSHEVLAAPDLARAHIEAWQDELHLRKALKTQSVAATALRGLLKWAVSHEVPINAALWLQVVTPSVPAGIPRPIPKRDFALIEEAFAPSEPKEILRLRTRALFWLMYSSGARISEALSLNRGAITDGVAHIVQKGGRPHLLIVNDQAQRAVADYMAARTDHHPSLFASLWYVDSPLRKREAQEAWDRLCEDLRIARFTSHQIRHSCGSTLRRRRVDVVLIAKHLGHRGLQHVMGYTDVDEEDRRQAVALLEGLAVG